MDWSIGEVARLTGITSRTLRHYDRIGLVVPSRVAENGYRHYDEAALLRLQRVLLLRALGVGLPAIARLLDETTDARAALLGHRTSLDRERRLLDRRITAVGNTIRALERGEGLTMETMFDGFDHTRHEEEVTERWGREAAERGDAWWSAMSAAERTAWQNRQAALAAAWVQAAETGADPAGPEAQALAERHAEWLSGIPGTPGAGGTPDPDYLAGLGRLYVDDERFAANYGGAAGAAFVRDALAVYAATLR